MRVAYFDLDKTLLSVNSADLWFRKMRKEKRVTWPQMAKGAYWMLQYHLGRANIEAQIQKAFAHLAGYSSDEVQSEFKVFFDENLRHRYRPGALKALQQHRESADHVCLLTSAPQIVADLVASDLKLDESLCTRLEVGDDGAFTGHINGPLCFGPGKVLVAIEHAKRLGSSLKESYFYTDSYSDVPMLKAVGTPVAINPDMRLLRFAKKHNWAIADWGTAS